MAHVEIITAGDDLPPERNALVRYALQRIGDSANGWHGRVESIEVLRVLEGGRSDSVVVEVALRAGAEYRKRVVKVGPASEIATEYANFHQLLTEYPAAVCAPILETTPGVLDPAERTGEVEAVVYTHVADYAGVPRTPSPTLEDLVHAALNGEVTLEEVRLTIARLFTKLAGPFHDRRDVRTARSLRDLNPLLGPDVVLGAAPVQAETTYPEGVLDASFGPNAFEVGQELRVASTGNAEIRVEVAGDSSGSVLTGHVLRSRFTYQRAKLDGDFSNVERSDGEVVADGVKTADPAGGLRTVLTDPRFGRVRSVVHGDLNARNVMCVEQQPIVIDFANTAEDQPLLSDAAWLEISLLRDVFAVLPYGDLVRVQRLLAVATRMRPLAGDPGKLDEAFSGFLTGDALTAFELLRELRVQSQLGYPGNDAWLDYLAQLHFSAYRTVKWTAHPDHALRAVHAAAAVATEWLVTKFPFAHWTGLQDLLHRISPLLDLTRPDAVAVVTSLLASLDRQPVHPAIDVDELRDRFVRTRYVEQARELVVALSREHGSYLDSQPLEHDSSRVVTGGPGAGKSRLLRELAYRRAIDIAEPGTPGGPLRMPFLLKANELLAASEEIPLPASHETLLLGAAHILVDGIDDQPAGSRARITAWGRALLDRFPRIRFTIAVRDDSRIAEALTLPVHPLRLWSDREVHRFLNTFPLRQSVKARLAKEVVEIHHADDGVVPGFVAAIAQASLNAEASLPPGDAYEAYFTRGCSADTVAALTSIAVADVGTRGPVRPAFNVDALLERGTLAVDGDGVRFAVLAARDFFAARALNAPAEFVQECARQFAWRDICLLAARLPSTSDQVVALMAGAVGAADPLFAARLLSFRSALAVDHLKTWATRLLDPGAGHNAHRTAAAALLATGTQAGRDALGRVLTDRAVPTSTQVQALNSLGDHLSEHTPHRAEPWVREILGAVLLAIPPDDVRIAAVTLIRDHGIRGLEVVLAELLRDGEPEVAVVAGDALHQLQVLVPPQLAELRVTLASQRLEQLEDRLAGLTVSAEIRATNDLRVRLLRQLDSGEELLRRRFDYGIADSVRDLLTDYQLSAESDESDVTANAQRILGQPQAPTEDRDTLVFSARPESSLQVLLIAAAATSSPAAVDHVADLVADLAAVVTTDRVEGLAALGHAVVRQDRRRGFIVTRRAARVLRDRKTSARHHWSWVTMLAHTSPGPAELDILLSDRIEVAVDELTKYALPLDGRGPEELRLSATAHDFVRTENGSDIGDRALAIAAAGLTEELPQVLQIAQNHEFVTVIETVSTGRYGIVEVAPLARVLAALGGLAAKSGEPGTTHHFLNSLDTTGLHPSVEGGRLVGLARLGDWEPLLLAAPGDGGPLDTASREAVTSWIPAPCTPAGLRGPASVALRLLALLNEPGVMPGRRSLLQELITKAEIANGQVLPR
ncbi:hypothetical protein [Amycolatopsis sp. NPDC098790]|uniref:hypothetical protein n=1 Tax=Amycolatopsis sp. NPDC098790 TaxID=3363939 RepID=UPI00381DB14D